MGNIHHISYHMCVDHGGFNSRTFQPSDQVRDSHFGWRRINICLPSEHKKAHFLLGQENGTKGNLGIRAIFYLALIIPKFAKSPMIYEICLLCHYMENTK